MADSEAFGLGLPSTPIQSSALAIWWACATASVPTLTTRLTNAFSKKIENHEHAIALHYFHYNFIRKHLTLKTTPAVAAGIASRELTIVDLVKMVEAEEAKLGERLTSYLPAKP